LDLLPSNNAPSPFSLSHQGRGAGVRGVYILKMTEPVIKKAAKRKIFAALSQQRLPYFDGIIP
jgi:hypothetical protein